MPRAVDVDGPAFALPRAAISPFVRRQLEDFCREAIAHWIMIYAGTSARLIMEKVKPETIEDITCLLLKEAGYDRWLVDPSGPTTEEIETMHQTLARVGDRHREALGEPFSYRLRPALITESVADDFVESLHLLLSQG